MKTLVERTPAQLDALTGGGPSNSPSPLCGMGYAEQLAAVTPRDDTNVAGPNLRGLPPLLGKAQKGPAGAAPKSFGNLDPGNRLAGVHPNMADRARLVEEIARMKGLDIFVTQGMRTVAEQNDLDAQGRTKPGKVVTWVRGGGSYHNHGLAVDFAFHGGAPYSEKHDWAGLVAAVKEAGLGRALRRFDRWRVAMPALPASRTSSSPSTSVLLASISSAPRSTIRATFRPRTSSRRRSRCHGVRSTTPGGSVTLPRPQAGRLAQLHRPFYWRRPSTRSMRQRSVGRRVVPLGRRTSQFRAVGAASRKRGISASNSVGPVPCSVRIR